MRIPQEENRVRADTVVGYRAPRETMKETALGIEANRLQRQANQFQRTAGLLSQGFDLASKIVEAGNVAELNKAEVAVDKSWKDLQLKLADTPYEEHEKLFDEWKNTAREAASKDMKWPGSKKHFDQAFEKLSNDYGFEVKKNVVSLRHRAQFADTVEAIDYWTKKGDFAKVNDIIGNAQNAMTISADQAVQFRAKADHDIAFEQVLAQAKQVPLGLGLEYLTNGKLPDSLDQDDRERLKSHLKTAYNEQETLAEKARVKRNEDQNQIAFEMFLTGQYDELLTAISSDIGEVKPGGAFADFTAQDQEHWYDNILAMRTKAGKTDEDWVDGEFDYLFTSQYMNPDKYDRNSLINLLKTGLTGGQISPKKAQEYYGKVDSKRADDSQDAGLQGVLDAYKEMLTKATKKEDRVRILNEMGEAKRIYLQRTANTDLKPQDKQKLAQDIVGEEKKKGLTAAISETLGGISRTIFGREDISTQMDKQTVNLASVGGQVEGFTPEEAKHLKLMKEDADYSMFTKERKTAMPIRKENPDTGEKIYSSTGNIDDWWKRDGKLWLWYDPEKGAFVKLDNKTFKAKWKKSK